MHHLSELPNQDVPSISKERENIFRQQQLLLLFVMSSSRMECKRQSKNAWRDA
jgi:hypothetical protein